MAKKRDINDYRQVKDTIYKPPVSHSLISRFPKKDGQSLYSVLFHYNYHQGKWFCFPSDQKRNYFNGNTTILGTGKDPEQAFQNFIKQQS